MKFLMIGFLTFSMWSAYATYLYVCKIKGLCYDRTTLLIAADVTKNNISSDTIAALPLPAFSQGFKNLVIHFAFDRSEFNSTLESDTYFKESKTYLDQHPGTHLAIEGYADATGTGEYNLALGQRRALSTQQYFEEKGIPSDRIIAESKGENDPAYTNSTEAGRAQNRRTSTTLIK